jgi:adenylate kinase
MSWAGTEPKRPKEE